MAWPAVVGAIAAALSALASAKGAFDPPENKSTTPVPAQGGGGGPAQDVFQSGVPNKQTKAPGKVGFEPTPIDIGAIINSVPQPTLKTKDIGTGGATVGEVLAATPDALQALSAILSLGQKPQRDRPTVIGAQGGGAGGQIVPGFGLPPAPQRRSIGDLLNSLPRARYG